MKKILIACLLVLIIVGGVGFYIFSQPSGNNLSDEFKKDALTKLLGRQVKLTDDTPQGDVEFDGEYISFRYPAKAIAYTYRETSTSSKSATLEDFSFDIKEPKLVFNYAVHQNNSNLSTISDFPAVKLRETRLYEYEKGSFEIDNASGIYYFKKENGPEKSGFLLLDGKIYSISITGTSANDVDNLFNSIVSSSKLK
jgi:hypothetical protein